MPFDDSVFDKPLDAEEKGKQKPAGFEGWFMSKATEIKCMFSEWRK